MLLKCVIDELLQTIYQCYGLEFMNFVVCSLRTATWCLMIAKKEGGDFLPIIGELFNY